MKDRIKQWNEIDNKFADKTDYETRGNILTYVKDTSIAFGLYLSERYTYHENLGLRDEAGRPTTIELCWESFIENNKQKKDS